MDKQGHLVMYSYQTLNSAIDSNFFSGIFALDTNHSVPSYTTLSTALKGSRRNVFLWFLIEDTANLGL